MPKMPVRLALLFLACSLNASSILAQCGVERWSVKTGTDADAGTVNVSTSTATTIAALRAIAKPATLPSNNRVQPTESTVYTLSATLISFKSESDSDYHLVIQDASGNTMIAEIASPNCVGAGSPLGPGITSSRAQFDAKYTATGSFQTVSVPVTIKGVGFFDFLHGQTGVAPNGIEIHPILDIQFGAGSPDFAMSASPTSVSVAQGSSGTSSISTTVSGGFNSAVSLSASGLPTGATATFSPTSIAAPGSGSSTMTINVGASTAAGTYTVTITGTGGGKTHTSTVSLTVTPTGGGGAIISDGFEAAGWSSTQVSGTAGAWSIVTSSSFPSISAHGGTHWADFNSYTSAAGSQTRFYRTSSFAVPSTYATITLTFWMYHDTGYSTSNDQVQAQVSTNGTTWTNAGSAVSRYNGSTGWAQASVDLTSYKGQTIYLGFLGIGAYGNDEYVDDAAVTGSGTSGGDTTLPTTSITVPANGATVSGTAAVTATASDNVGVTKIEIYIDGTLRTSNTNATSLSYSWNTTTFTNGSHTIMSKAYDAAGNIGSSTNVTVTVSNTTAAQILGNPGFETGTASPWVATTGVVDSSTSEAAHAGSWKAWLNGYGSAHNRHALSTGRDLVDGDERNADVLAAHRHRRDDHDDRVRHARRAGAQLFGYGARHTRFLLESQRQHGLRAEDVRSDDIQRADDSGVSRRYRRWDQSDVVRRG